MKNKYSYLILIILILVVKNGYSQDTEFNKGNGEKNHKNALVISAGGATDGYGAFGAWTINYERTIYSGSSGLKFGVSAGAGKAISYDIPYNLKAFGLFGKKNSKLELAFGVSSYIYGYDYWTFECKKEIKPAYTLGYRYQPPSKRFLLRFGVGLPEFLSIGFGVQF